MSDPVNHPGERPVPGWPNYAVTREGEVVCLGRVVIRSDGRPWTLKRRVLRLTKGKRGYYHVWLRDGRPGSGKRARLAYAHQLVLEAFVGPKPEGSVCRHLDGNKQNCCLQNLVWGTHLDNHEDAMLHGSLERAADGKFRSPCNTTL